MGAFAELISADPPRLVVLYKRGSDGSANFQWGVVGSIPVLDLIGAVAAAEAVLATGFAAMELCDQPAIVLAWDAASASVRAFAHPDIPRGPLVGMLEVVKEVLVASQVERMAPHKSSIVGPDGAPFRRVV